MKFVKTIVSLGILLSIINVNATNGPLKQNSIIECNGIYYGKHGTPSHWHVAEYKKDKWVSVGEVVDIPPCYIKVPNIKEKVLFSKCSDGDTASFIINGKEKKVRFLAINTPEIGDNIEPFGKEASEYTCNKIKNAKEIYLEYDGASDKEDKYGRVLAFVYVDGKLLEKELIQNGLAKVAYIYGDYEYVDELRKEEEIAKSKRIGIWQEEITLPDEETTPPTTEEENSTLKIINFIIEIIKKIFALLFN